MLLKSLEIITWLVQYLHKESLSNNVTGLTKATNLPLPTSMHLDIRSPSINTLSFLQDIDKPSNHIQVSLMNWPISLISSRVLCPHAPSYVGNQLRLKLMVHEYQCTCAAVNMGQKYHLWKDICNDKYYIQSTFWCCIFITIFHVILGDPTHI